MSTTWKDIVGAVAPALATALGGPLAGTAVRALSTKLLGRDDGTEEDVAKAVLGADPATLLKLKELDKDFAVQMRQLDVDLEKVAAGDRDSARQREIQTRDTAPATLACVVVGGFFSVLGLLVFAHIPESAQQPINLLLGALTAMLTQVGNYYFGSSAGSSHKNTIIQKALEGQQHIGIVD